MAQTTAQKEKAIRFGSGILKIDWVDIGLLDTAVLNVEYNTIAIRAHNWNIPPKKKPSAVKLTAEIYEIDPENLAKVDWGGVKSSFAGSPVNVTWEEITSRTVWTPIKLANANNDWTKVTAVDVTVDWTSITDWTDYRIFALNWHSYIEPLISKSGEILVDYTYTPASKTRYTISDVAKALMMYEVVFENVDENWKKFVITIPKWNASGNLSLWFVSDDATDEVMKLPIEFTANPDWNNVLVYIDDEQQS